MSSTRSCHVQSRPSVMLPCWRSSSRNFLFAASSSSCRRTISISLRFGGGQIVEAILQARAHALVDLVKAVLGEPGAENPAPLRAGRPIAVQEAHRLNAADLDRAADCNPLLERLVVAQ